jgi:hypothetical protein
MNRTEHLKWCKDRALEYVEAGELTEAFTSMISDLQKHPETEKHAGMQLGMGLLFSGHLDSASEMKKFIEGFN